MSRPPLRGFNHNIRYRNRTYHVQTEDSGIDNPHLFTHLYQGGVIIASAKTEYGDLVADPEHKPRVTKMMQEQHKQLMKQLRRGEFDDKIVGLLGRLEPEEAQLAAPAAAPAPEAPAAEGPAPEVPAAAAGAGDSLADLAAAAAPPTMPAAMRDTALQPVSDLFEPATLRLREEPERTTVDARPPLEQTVRTPPPQMSEAAESFDDLVFDRPPGRASPPSPARDPGETAPIDEDELQTDRLAVPFSTTPVAHDAVRAPQARERSASPAAEPARSRQLSPVRLRPPTVEPPSVGTPKELPMITDEMIDSHAPLPDDTAQPRRGPVFASLLDAGGQAQGQRRQLVNLQLEGEAQTTADPDLLVDRPPESWASAAEVTGYSVKSAEVLEPFDPARTSRDARAPASQHGSADESRPGSRSCGQTLRSGVFDAPLPKDSRLPTPSEMLNAVPSRKRRSGVYPLPAQMPQRPPHPDPTMRRPAPPLGSTPQRYTAPTRGGQPSRMTRVTGSYRVPSGIVPVTEVSHQGRPLPPPQRTPPQRTPPQRTPPQRPRPPGPAAHAQPTSPPRAPSVSVVARPAIILDGSGPSQPQKPLPPPAPPTNRSGERPAAAPPHASAPPRRAQASVRAMPNIFGSDLISERSLDEVILGYLAEEDGGRKGEDR